jgi:hypothetical protein
MDTFASRKRRLLDVLQSDMLQRENAPVPSIPSRAQTAFGILPGPMAAGLISSGETLRAFMPEHLRRGNGYGQQPPSMTMGMGNPPMTMGAGLPQLGNTSQAPGWGQMPIPQPSPDMPAPNAAAAGPASIPMPPQRPASMGGGTPLQLPGARPVEQEGAVSMPSAGLALIRGYNPQAFGGNPQAVADQFTNGELEKLRARTYRNEDGSMWNDYYVG